MAHSTTVSESGHNPARTLPMSIYILFLMGILTVVTAPVGVVIAHFAGRKSPEWIRSHFRFQVRTFWLGLPILALGLALAMHLVGYLIITFWIFWSIARCASGINYLIEDGAVPNPKSLWLGAASD